MAQAQRRRLETMKATLTEQNDAIVIYKKQLSEYELFKTFAVNLARARPKIDESFEDYEEVTIPTDRVESIATMTPTALVQYVISYYNAVQLGAFQAQENYSTIAAGLDEEIDEQINRWNTIRTATSKTAKAEAFREASSRTPTQTRPETPDVPLVNRTRVDSGATTPASVESSQKKTKTKPTGEAKKGKKTELLSSVFSNGEKKTSEAKETPAKD